MVTASLASLLALAGPPRFEQIEQPVLRVFTAEPQRRSEPKQPPKERPRRTEAAPRPATPLSEPVPADVPRRTAAPSPPPTPAPALAAPKLPDARPVQVTPPLPSPSAAPANTDALRDRYSAALWRHIDARLPRGIRMRGEVRVGFTVTRSGSVQDIAIDTSSGNPMLDRLALRTLNRAGPMPPPPAELGDGPLRFTITIAFD
ncbi:TonB family protein [Sphingosinithalassobacter tenebrarum]|uniref:TonB family protein n=2 Tax=Stakelama tenebrarum TaxID=2711215 RepID=A0A6G6YAH6_9SPHN|nr:TonB family protein [Sphingosinithalassobacter tenebrarum]